MKRIIALLLVLLMTAPAIVACGKDEKETTPQGTGNPVDTNPEETEETEKPTPNWDSVDKTSLNGMTINIHSMESVKIDVEDYTSDILDTAIFDRNRLLEQTLDCEIDTVVYESDLKDSVITAISGGDGSMDLVVAWHEDAGHLMTNGHLLPFNYIEGLDLTQPWWDQTGMRDTSIHGYNFFGWLDFNFGHYDTMRVLAYNSEIINDYQLEDPYDLYKNNAWTIDKFIELVEEASDDTNGDGIMDKAVDTYGYSGDFAEGMEMLHASGYHMIDWNEEESTFVFHMPEEGYIAVLEKIARIGSSVNRANYWVKESSNEEDGNTFMQGRALFYGGKLAKLQDFRENEDNYGLMMFPRYDYTNAESTTLAWGGQPLLLPKDIGDDNKDGEDDFKELGIFLQAAGAYTHDVIIDVYMEKHVIGKGLRNENSKEIFEIMVKNRSVEFGVYFQPYGFSTTINTQTDALWGPGDGFASAAQNHMTKFTAMAARLVTTVEDQLDALGLPY